MTTTTNEDGSRCSAAALEINPREGKNMTNIADVKKASKYLLQEWCDQVRAIRAEIGDIGDDDPRLPILAREWKHGASVIDYPPAGRGDAWFELYAEIPPMPVPAPAWAAVAHLQQDDYPVMTVEWNDRDPETDYDGPLMVQYLSVYVEDRDGHRAGEIIAGGRDPLLDVGDIDSILTLADARKLRDELNAFFATVQEANR